MSKSSDESFFKPVLSTFGLILSFIAAVSPIFPITQISAYFIETKYVIPASVLSVILGLIISWMVFTFYSYIEIRIGTKKVGEYFMPKFRLGTTGIIWSLLVIILILFAVFFSTGAGLFQATIYILFFSTVIFAFSLLVSITKSRYEYIANKDSQADRIFRTLEKNRLISPGISIYANEPVTQQEWKDLDLRNMGMLRKIKVETVVQEKEHIEVIMTDDCSELIKVLRKRKVE